MRRYERALARTDEECRRRVQKHLLPPTDDPNNLDAICPAAAPPHSAPLKVSSSGQKATTGATPTPGRDEGGRLPALGAREAGAQGRLLQPPRRRGTKGRRSAGRADGVPEVRGTPTLAGRNEFVAIEPNAEPSSSGEWSAIVRAKPRRRTGRSRRSAEAAEGDPDSTGRSRRSAEAAEGDPDSTTLPTAEGLVASATGPAPTLQVAVDHPETDASSSGEWASLVEVKRQIDFRQARGDFSPPVTPVSELREGSAEDFEQAEQAEWRHSALPKVVGARRAVDWRTDVIDIQTQLDSLASLPYSLNELKLDASTSAGNPAEAWNVTEEER